MTYTMDEAVAAIMAAPQGPEVCAFFDFDGTLIDSYSATAYFTDRVRSGEADWREIAGMLKLLMHGELSDEEFKQVISNGVLDWAGRTETDMQTLWTRLFKEKISDWLFPEAWRLVQAHKRRGHTIVIASSATPYQAAPLAAEMGIKHLLCTQPMIRNGKLTGGIVGEPLWGEGKANAVKKFAKAHKISLKACYAYANGNEDVPFLKTVGHATAVNAKEALTHVAGERGWPQLRFERRSKTSLSAVARTVGAYGAMAASFVIGLGYAKATGKTRRAVDMISAVGSDWGLAVAGIEVEVQGEHNLWAQRPAVFLLNHQSKLDFFVMMYITRRGFTGVAKKEAANTPGFGPFMRMADMVFIDRANVAHAREALSPVVEKIKAGLCLCIAPEGTRSCSPRIGLFKKGAFHIARQAGVPVVPVVIRNAAEMMSRNGQSFRPGKVQVAVLPPIDVQGWKLSEMDEKVAEVRQLFVDTLDRWPGETFGAQR
ncbi:MAG: HAD-superfamily subfamily hydrolase [Nevskia sp.]|nr:HAD-superfamily subfamily hydrolase [Nevskia sp.]